MFIRGTCSLTRSSYALCHHCRAYKFDYIREFSANKEPPGFVASHRWVKQRTLNTELEKQIYGDNKYDNDNNVQSFLSTNVDPKLTGLPIQNGVSFVAPTNVNEINLLDTKLLSNLVKMGFNQLTPVQRYSISVLSIDSSENVQILSRDKENENKLFERITGYYDLMAAAQTGSGKTLAYLIPILNRLLRIYPYEAMNSLLSNPECQFPSGLVLVPTRELVMQIASEINKLCYRTFLRSVSLFGGERPDRQIYQLSKGCHFVVATPGRLLDMLNRNMVNLEHCRSLILDEADRMLDMGFEVQLREIMETPGFKMPKATNEERQTGLFSATFPKEVATLAKDFLRGSRCVSLSLCDPDYGSGVIVPSWGSKVSTNKTNELNQLTRIIPKEIVQRIEFIPKNAKISIETKLLSIVNELLDVNTEKTSRVLVFCNTKREVDRYDKFLYQNQLKSASLHGDKSQSERTKALQLFREGRVNVLVASSVASRGLDIPNVRAVINIEFPNHLEDYVHRIGRTGRMGQSGEAITLVTESALRDDPVTKGVCAGVCRIIQASVGNLDNIPEEISKLANHSNPIGQYNTGRSHPRVEYRKHKNYSYGINRRYP